MIDFGRCLRGGVEFDADSVFGEPDRAARSGHFLAINLKVEFVRDAGDTSDLQAGAFCGKIAHDAIDGGVLLIEQDLARQERSRPQYAAAILHGP
jgi:hypothetical protein